MKVSLCFFVLLTITFANFSSANVDHVFEAFSKAKVLESCFGVDNTQQYNQKVIDSVKQCSTETQAVPKTEPVKASDAEDENANAAVSTLDEVEGESIFGPNFKWQDLFNPKKLIRLGSRRVIPVPVAVDQSDIERLMFFRRDKRQAEELLFSENAVRALKTRMERHLSNITCVLQKMNYINSKQQLEFDFIIEGVKNSNMNQELKQDLVQGYEQCKEMSTCLPAEGMRSAIPQNLKRVIHFSKCAEKQRLMACMRNDLRKRRDQFELQGLDGILNNLEEDDQMLAIVWSNTMLNSGKKHALDVVY